MLAGPGSKAAAMPRADCRCRGLLASRVWLVNGDGPMNGDGPIINTFKKYI